MVLIILSVLMVDIRTILNNDDDDDSNGLMSRLYDTIRSYNVEHAAQIHFEDNDTLLLTRFNEQSDGRFLSDKGSLLAVNHFNLVNFLTISTV